MGIKKVPTSGWIKIGAVGAIMAGVLIFKPDFNEVPGLVYGISGVIGVWILYEVLRMTGILGKIFNKKN